VTLRIDWCSHQAAHHAVTHWHYSKSMPAGKAVKVGAWEDGQFIGAVIFSRGATINIGTPFGLPQTSVCELTRVALRDHTAPVSRILSIALRFLRRQCPGLELIVSFADEGQGHVGGIYQATNWIYLGSQAYHAYRVKGRLVHPKTLHSRYGKGGQSIPWLRANVDPRAERVTTGVKHKYVMPLNDRTRAAIAPLARPYPKRAESIAAMRPPIQVEEGGSTPTSALLSESA
jgi:hypothetical protein